MSTIFDPYFGTFTVYIVVCAVYSRQAVHHTHSYWLQVAALALAVFALAKTAGYQFWMTTLRDGPMII